MREPIVCLKLTKEFFSLNEFTNEEMYCTLVAFLLTACDLADDREKSFKNLIDGLTASFNRSSGKKSGKNELD